MANSSSGDISEAKFLTVAEVAAMMRVSKMTVYRLVHNGELPAVRVGRSFRVREEDANEYLRKSYLQRRLTAREHAATTPSGTSRGRPLGGPGPPNSACLARADRLSGSPGLSTRLGTASCERYPVGSVIKKRRKRMAKKKHRKLLKKTRVQRRKLGK